MKTPPIKQLIKAPIDIVTNFVNARVPRERLLIMGLAATLVFFADYFLWLAPVSKALMATAPKISSLQNELDGLRQDKKDKHVIELKWESVQKELEDKERRIGASSQISSLLENLSKLASESGVRITSIKPTETTNNESNKKYYAVPVQLSATAGTHELGQFLMKLETADTFFKIIDLKISTNPSNEKKHLIEMKVQTYRKA